MIQRKMTSGTNGKRSSTSKTAMTRAAAIGSFWVCVGTVSSRPNIQRSAQRSEMYSGLDRQMMDMLLTGVKRNRKETLMVCFDVPVDDNREYDGV